MQKTIPYINQNYNETNLREKGKENHLKSENNSIANGKEITGRSRMNINNHLLQQQQQQLQQQQLQQQKVNLNIPLNIPNSPYKIPIKSLEERYQLLSELGSGSFGKVTLAKIRSKNENQIFENMCKHKNTLLFPLNSDNNKTSNYTVVAIKTMIKKLNNLQDYSRVKEVNFIYQVKSDPSLIQIYDVFVDKNSLKLHIVMESMDQNLYQLMKKRKSTLFSPITMKSILSQILAGITHIHSCNYFHRDVKPENILVTNSIQYQSDLIARGLPAIKDSYVVKLADYGLARNINNLKPYTSYVSTRWYRSPEILLRQNYYSYPADIWAFGCVLIEIANFAPLFPGSNELDQTWRVLEALGSPYPFVDFDDKVKETPLGGLWNKAEPLANELGFHLPKVEGLSIQKIIRRQDIDELERVELYKVASGCLKWDPSLRLSALELCNLPYFKGTMASKKYDEIVNQNNKNNNIHYNSLNYSSAIANNEITNNLHTAYSINSENQSNTSHIMNSNTIATTAETSTTGALNNSINNNNNSNNNNSNNFFSKSKFLAGLTNGETISNVLAPLRYSNKANISMNKNINLPIKVVNNNINEQIISESCVYADPHSYGGYNFIPAVKTTYSNFEDQLANKSFEIRSNNETDGDSYVGNNMEENIDQRNYIYENNKNNNIDSIDRNINSRTSSVYNQLLEEYGNENANNSEANEKCEMSFYPNDDDDIESDNLSCNDMNHIRPKDNEEFSNANDNIGFDSGNEFHGFSGVIDEEILEGSIEFINKDSNDYFPSTFASANENENENNVDVEKQEFFMLNDNKNYSEKTNAGSSCRSISSTSVNFEDFEDFDYKKFDKDYLSVKKAMIDSDVNVNSINNTNSNITNDNNIYSSHYVNHGYNNDKFIETNNSSDEANNAVDETISSFHDAYSQFQNDINILKDINGNDNVINDNVINDRLAEYSAINENNNNNNMHVDSESNSLKHLIEENLHIHSFLKSIKNLNPCATYGNMN
ncbi:unnamed protein product [[Candida] boidinii]|uniref:Unnamed protein product n=1 Tax=Candida boidinii TaxID=5477 RepID=A0A9W6WDT7_CANBO|nr:protein kinase activity protein [[Candida] boidinii]GME67419.1 unnamed protein product [[Candida] boidinii]GMF98227.1 unnamed protein product [[Candida] boidinii]